MNIEEIKKVLDYNPDTGVFTWKVDIAKNVKKDSVAGCKDKDGYIVISINRKQYRAHRIAYMFVHGKLENQIDHVNRVKSDNRIINLRECTHTQNHHNVTVRSDNKLGIKGVCFKRDHYQARITVGGIDIYLGTYDTAAEASEVYRETAKILHGEFFYEENR